MSDSISIGTRGWHEAAISHSYENAIATYTVGIRKFPNSVKMYNNRCYCYLQLKQYQDALKDADAMISKFPEDYRGYYRRGEILGYLRLYKEAEKAYNKCLKLKPDLKSALNEKYEINVERLCKNGKYSRSLVLTALEACGNWEEVENLLQSGFYFDSYKNTVYHSDDEDGNSDNTNWRNRQKERYLSISSDLMDCQFGMELQIACNSIASTNLHISNVYQAVTFKTLTSIFSNYGRVKDIQAQFSQGHVLVKYFDLTSAAKAMHALQGKKIGNNNGIKIRYPKKCLQPAK